MNILQYENIFFGLPPSFLSRDDVVAIDLELTGLKENQLHRPYGDLVSVACSYDGKSAYIIQDPQQIPELLELIAPAMWVFHNSLFDLGHLRRWATIEERRNMWDTLLVERIMFGGYYELDVYSLADLVRRYLGAYMEKDTRGEFRAHSGNLTQNQAVYAALDVIGTWQVYQEQKKIINKKDTSIWFGMYCPHVWAVLEFGGFYLDKNCWITLTNNYQKTVNEISLRLGKEYGQVVEKFSGRGKSKTVYKEFVPYNLNSIPQTLKILHSLGILVPNTDEKALTPYRDSFPFVDDLLKYREAQKQVSTYGMRFLDMVEPDSRIYTSLNIGLAETGRDSSSSPNLQNIPATKERRKCFTAGPGKVLCIYDYSGQESALWAHLSQDKKIAEIINAGKNLYIEVAREAFNEVITKEHPRYKKVKSMVLGLFYGLTPYGLSCNEGMEFDEAKEMFDRFFMAFPQSANYVQQMQSKNRGYVETVFGQKIHLHPYDYQWKNNALNAPMQGTAANMIKIAIKRIRSHPFYKNHHKLGNLHLVLQVHDEIIMECDKTIADEWSPIMRQIMIDVAESIHPGIRGNVTGGIMQTWAEKE